MTAQAKAETRARSINGRQLGAYQILSLLGAGGMGEVYRAEDTRLDRTVAIKVLPSEVSDKPEMRQRFEREAQVISSLSRPHICALYDRSSRRRRFPGDGIPRRRDAGRSAEQGALPIDQALRFAVEIADALDQAHRHGVVHRDLKPGNIMLTKSGIKLLDFGLAKLRDPKSTLIFIQPFGAAHRESQSDGGRDHSRYAALHGAGTTGGERADARADVFAFGAVVYEMVTGRELPGRKHGECHCGDSVF